MSKNVHVVLSDRGWILEKLARELADRLPYVSFDTAICKPVPIHYYMTYGCRLERVSPIELAFFTHLEQDSNAAQRFFETAGSVDHCVSMSRQTDSILAGAHIASRSVISPGVDFERFKPALRIAVVGRTYHTGRKGEHVVAQVMDIPDIEWFFTGDGWPQPGIDLSEGELPGFYRSMDYLLVPSLNEGGPMPVLEALASGVEVISGPVGWVGEFPHIEFEIGNADSLRRLLLDLREKKFRLRDSVAKMTWDHWAQAHDELFTRLSSQKGSVGTSVISSTSRRVRSAALVTHGIEHTTIGGPSLRVPKTAEILRRQHISAQSLRFPTLSLSDQDLIHGFNIWLPQDAVKLARRVSALGKPLVFSPILLDLSEAPLWQVELTKVFHRAATADQAEELVAQARICAAQKIRPAGDNEPGYSAALREIAARSDAFIFLSERERELCRRLGAEPAYAEIVRNPVDAALFSQGDPQLFRSAFGVSDYVLCVGRIEPRKNQLLLALALRGSGIPLVLIGHSSSQHYMKKIREFGGPDLIIVDRLEAGSEMLRSALAGARVFALPSWAEGAPLAALEAGAAGTRMVLSDRSGEREYFGDLATYCDPSDPASIRAAVIEAWESDWAQDRRAALQAHVQDCFSWERYGAETAQVYEEAARRRSERPSAIASARAEHRQEKNEDGTIDIILDVTTSFHYSHLRSGIVRVERALALSLGNDPRANVHYVTFRGPTDFVSVPPEIVRSQAYHGYMKAATLQSPEVGSFRPGSRLLVVGSSWMQNAHYAETVRRFSLEHRLVPSVLMHDLTPRLFPHWYPEGYAKTWNSNLAVMLQNAGQLLVYSESTRKDVEEAAATLDIDIGPVGMIRLADEIGVHTARDFSADFESARQVFSSRPFILATGAVHFRKNYSLLHDCWIELRRLLGDRCPLLVIVGGVAWNGKEIARGIQEDPRIKDFIHLLDDIDDTTLDWLYRNCLLTVYPSLYEGWGLPVGESLAYGKICLATNSSSVPEIAPELTDLLDPHDRKAWIARIQFYAGSPAARSQREAEIRARYKTTGWAETARGLVTALSESLPAKPRAFYTLGSVVTFKRPEKVTLFKGDGWCPCESWGNWSKARSAWLHLNLAQPPKENLVLAGLVKALHDTAEPRDFSIWVNGRKVADWYLSEADYSVRVAYLPKELVDEDGRVDIEIRSGKLVSMKMVDPASPDMRTLGIGLSALRLEEASRAQDPWHVFSRSSEVHQALGNEVATAVASDIWPLFTAGSWNSFVDPSFTKFFAGVRAIDPAWGVVGEGGRLRLYGGAASLEYRTDTKVRLIVRAVATREAPLSITVLGSDRIFTEWQFDSDAPAWMEFVIPGDCLGKRDPLEIVLVASHAASPASLSLGKLDWPVSFGVLGVNVSQPFRDDAVEASDLPIGQMVSLSDEWPETKSYLPSGWYPSEFFGAWSMGSAGVLRFAVNSPDARDLVLLARLSALPEVAAAGQVTVHREAAVVGRVVFPPGDDGSLTDTMAVLDLGDHRPGRSVAELCFHVPQAGFRPGSIQEGGDERPLGIALRTIELKRLACYETIDTIDRLWSQVYVEGWYEPEDGGRWTNSHRARLITRLPGNADADLQLTLRFMALGATAVSPIRVTVLANGSPAGNWLVHSEEPVLGVLELSQDVLYNTGLLDLTLITDRLVAPIELGLSLDARPLGIRLIGFEIAPPQGGG